ncbi:MAG: hypothetical protein ACTS5I_02225, partial [Rhodanobacter sp.]
RRGGEWPALGAATSVLMGDKRRVPSTWHADQPRLLWLQALWESLPKANAIEVARAATGQLPWHGNIPPHERRSARACADNGHALTHGARRAQAVGLRGVVIAAVIRDLKQ